MIAQLIDRFRDEKRRRYIRALQRRGLNLGTNVELNDGFFLDPSHCFLIKIEDWVVFGPSVKVFAHDASSFKLLGQTKLGLVLLKRNSFIGANSVIMPGVTVGENSIVAVNSTVTKDIPANEVWGGSPAKFITTVNEYKAKLISLRAPTFDETLYSISQISEERKKEMIEVLKSSRVAMMKRNFS